MASNNIFNTVLVEKPKYSTFDLSHDHKTTMRMGRLIPFEVIECVPGDRLQVSNEVLARFMPMIAPVMHKIDMYIHHFFVPNRIMWKNFEKFITDDGTTEDAPVWPTISSPEIPIDSSASTLANYLGMPVGTIKEPVSAMPFAAYQKIWLDYYRDQNVTESEEDRFALRDGLQDPFVIQDLKRMRNRAWQHDYFTSCLPFAQKGEALGIPIALGGSASVELDPTLPYPHMPKWASAFDGSTPVTPKQFGKHTPAGQLLPDDDAYNLQYDPNGTLRVNGSDFSEMEGTINDLRTAFTLQKWLEKNARGGTRYIELIRAHFGVQSSDKRLQRAEYIGGSFQPVVISEVLQTSETDTSPTSVTPGTPQGNMAGHGISVGSGKTSSYAVEEHGYFISIISCLPQTAYQQGIPKHFQKFDKFDLLWPDFATLGEQPVLGKELYYDPADPEGNESVFGYLPRYSEYRFLNNRISGQMAQTLNFWHLGRIFDSRPNLNGSFIYADPSKRIFAIDDYSEDEIVLHIFSKIRARRALPYYGVPGGI